MSTHPVLRVIAGLLLALAAAVSLLVTLFPHPAPASSSVPAPSAQPPVQQPSIPKLVFGLGPTASGARKSALTLQSPVGMLTTWYNGPSDLTWMASWKHGVIPQAYAAGYALHLIVYVDETESTIATSYGPACGRPYPLSAGFLGDMRALAQTFAGSVNGPPLYVTLFTEFQTYPCTDNAWSPNAPTNAYYRALKDRYLAARDAMKQSAPNARVSLGWGGWQTRWDDPAQGAGRSMFQYFDDVMRVSDFQSFQAMGSDDNIEDVRAMVKRLGTYGPVLLAHYKPDNGSQATFEHDLRAMLTDAYLTEVTHDGLFAWSFMDEQNIDDSAAMFQLTKQAVQRYAH
jgi:hypothetical protein